MNNVVNVTYRTSNGIEYPFQIDALRIKETNFHKWNYVPNALTRRFGDWLLRFDKEAATYEAMLYAYGSRTERRDFLDRLHKAFEHDIRAAKTGRLTYGDSYIDCFIIASSTYPHDDVQHITVNEIEIYCPYPFWIEPRVYDFTNSGADGALVGSAYVGLAILGNNIIDDSKEFLDYPIGYEYDYSTLLTSSQIINNDSPSPCPFKCVIYGGVSNPYFYIGDQMYAVNTTVQAGEYLTIDSQAKTVLRTMVDGQIINEFNNRSKITSIFDPVPEGDVRIIWPSIFGMTLTLYLERSEPIWS